MANGNSLFAFVAGALTGAALLFLAKTEKGEKVVEDIKEKGTEAFTNGRAAVLKGLDKVEDALKEKKQARSRKTAEE
ncbi:MAG: hypothetical protein IKN00_05590 [Bacteroidales bacterium]|nr:hypothetical protein [Bacteroidales bacterium]